MLCPHPFKSVIGACCWQSCSRSPVQPSFEQTQRLLALSSIQVGHGDKPKQVSLPLTWSASRKGDTLVLYKTSDDSLVKETVISCGANDSVTVTHPEVCGAASEERGPSSTMFCPRGQNVVVQAKRTTNMPEHAHDGIILYNIRPNARLQIRCGHIRIRCNAALSLLLMIMLYRKRQDGDIFHPETKANPGKLSIFLRNLLLPLHIRDDLLLVCGEKPEAGKQEVLAVYPEHLSTDYTSDTTGHPPLYLQLETIATS